MLINNDLIVVVRVDLLYKMEITLLGVGLVDMKQASQVKIKVKNKP